MLPHKGIGVTAGSIPVPPTTNYPSTREALYAGHLAFGVILIKINGKLASYTVATPELLPRSNITEAGVLAMPNSRFSYPAPSGDSPRPAQSILTRYGVTTLRFAGGDRGALPMNTRTHQCPNFRYSGVHESDNRGKPGWSTCPC
jgi:hypothetical protein